MLYALWSSSIRARLQKKLNVCRSQGTRAGTQIRQFLGSKPQPLLALKGSPVLLFFWLTGVATAKLKRRLLLSCALNSRPRLKVVGPTRLYGNTAQTDHAAPQDELAYIDAVRRRFYSGLLDMPSPSA